MKAEPGDTREYGQALVGFLSGGGESSLNLAYQIGREAISEGLTSLVTFHGEALKRVLADPGLSPSERETVIERSTQFLEETLAPFEMTVRGFQETNDRLLRANQELTRADELKNRFLAHMSHELRTPLNSIIGYCDLLLSDPQSPPSPSLQHSLGTIHANGKQLLGMVNDLLDVAKAEAGMLEVEIQEIAVQPVVEHCLDQARPLAEAKRILLSADLEAGARAQADPERLGQVVLNLLSNAIKFTPEAGRVFVRASTVGTSVAVAVVDNGIGIAPADQTQVFKEFIQLEAGRAAGRGGTGLGLALSQRLANLMGGRIELLSQPGKGSAFTVLLPTTSA